MFRMILYMYELKHAKKPEPLIDTLGYFFLLPNYCFLHFPVVDYRTMQRGYFARDIHAIQRARPADDVPGRDPPAALSPGLSRAADPGRGGPRRGEPGGLPRVQLPALPPRLGPVPHGLRHAPPVRVPAPRDAPPLPAGDRVHRLLAADQHLLEGLHGPGRVQPGGLPPQATGRSRWRWRRRRPPSSWRPGCSTLTSRSGCGGPGASACPTPCSGASSASWCSSTSSSTPVAAAPGRPSAATHAPLAIRAAKTAARSRRSRCSGRSGRAPSVDAWLGMLPAGDEDLNVDSEHLGTLVDREAAKHAARPSHRSLMTAQLLATWRCWPGAWSPAGLASGRTSRSGGAAVRRAEPRRLRTDGAGLLRTPARRGPPQLGTLGRAEVDAAAAAAGTGRDGCTSRRRRSRPGRWRRGRRRPRVRAQAEPDFDHEGARWSTNAPGDARPRVRHRQAAATRSGSPSWATRSARAGGQRRRGVRADSWSGASTSGRDGGADRRSRSSTSPCRGTGPASAGTTSRGSAGRSARTWSSSSRPWPTPAGTSARLRGLLPRGIGWDVAAVPRRPGRLGGAARRDGRGRTSGCSGPSATPSSRGSTARSSTTAGRAACRASWSGPAGRQGRRPGRADARGRRWRRPRASRRSST